MMKRFAVTAFAILYAVLIVAGSAQRSIDWAVKEAETLAHHHAEHATKTFNKGGKPDSHLYQTRLLETGFSVELPKEAPAPPLPTQRHANRLTNNLYLSPFATLISSRAPPFLI